MGLKFKPKAMLLRFELDNQVLHELDSSSVVDEIDIGRDSSCTWKIPYTDKSASNRHARIYRKRGHLFIEDTDSRNGIYLKGEKIQSRKLAVGDQIGVGDCKLCVESALERVSRASHHCNRLEQLNGAAKGTLYELDKEQIKIGSSGSCDIVFSDTVISQIHAAIEQKSDGSSWIKDMGSRNGTMVNGAKLSSNLNDSGRMLRDGDVVTVSYVEMRFWDQYETHVRSYLWLKVVAVALSAAVILGGYFGWQWIMPSAKNHIERARRYAAVHHFDQARRHLEKAADAKGADLHKVERMELFSQLKQWENTIKHWDDVQSMLLEKKWISANKVLSPMLSSNMELWRWNDTDANTSKNEALLVKRILDVFLQGRAILEEPESTLPQMRGARQSIKRELSAFSSDLPKHLAMLKAAAFDVEEELSVTGNELESIGTALALQAGKNDIESAIATIEKLRAQSRKRVASRKSKGLRYSPKVEITCRDVLSPLHKLGEAKKVLDANYANAAMLKFDAIKASLPLPAVAECGVSPVLADRRAVLEELNRQLLDNARQLSAITGVLRREQLMPDGNPDWRKRIFSSEVTAKVFACDSLELAAPRWNRKEPSGVYDRTVGVEFFYGFLKALPDEFDSNLLSDSGFTPDIFAARRAYSYLETYLKFTEKDTMSMIRDNKCVGNLVQQLALRAYDLLDERDKMLAGLVRELNGGDGRSAVIAGGIALLLKGGSKAVPASTAETVEGKMKKVKSAVAEIGKQEASPEEIILRRKEMLKIGIPGDPLIKQAWAESGKSEK